jgi:hypothetical protein
MVSGIFVVFLSLLSVQVKCAGSAALPGETGCQPETIDLTVDFLG